MSIQNRSILQNVVVVAVLYMEFHFSVPSHKSHSMTVTKAWENTAGHTIRLCTQAQNCEKDDVSAVDSFL